MRSAQRTITEQDLIFSVFQGWGLRLLDVTYVPVGYGSHHWLTADDTGVRHWSELSGRPVDEQVIACTACGGIRTTCRPF